MDYHVKEYFSDRARDAPRGNFHKVIVLHDAPDIDWGTISEIVPSLSPGWFELAQLSRKDRIEFIQEYWLSKLKGSLRFSQFLIYFFQSIDDIGVFITQRTVDDPFVSHLVYSLKNNTGFFKGEIPASDQDIEQLKADFSEFTLPEDFIAFLQVHNGFAKATDCTGVTPSYLLKERYEAFQRMLQKNDLVTTNKGKAVNPHDLIPFYESFGMPFYQCFWSEWYPESEMGNVYYSALTNKISDEDGDQVENLAFSTFLDWLAFYLEQIEI